ncbi:MAG: carotenoid biosynthesis protein [Thermodesulfobacteriota bacterium]
MELFLGTVLLRPYVFAFLALYLLGSSLQFGCKVTWAFLPLGYFTAFLSELCSIHWGFPYGDYYYIEATKDKEIWVLGVPFMDSLSYVFLAASSYSTAAFLMAPLSRVSMGWRLARESQVRQSPSVWLLGSMLMVLLDVVIDPVALQGERWFLGKIYGYRTPGHYFGIPMSNFAGWFLVALVMVKLLQMLEARWGTEARGPWVLGFQLAALWGPTLYLGILLFNIAITFWIGEITLGIASSFLAGTWVLMAAVMTIYKCKDSFQD